MRKKAFVAGILLIVIGSMGYMAGQNIVNSGNTISGQINRTFDSGAQSNYQYGSLISVISVGLFFGGIGLTAYGAIRKRKGKSTIATT